MFDLLYDESLRIGNILGCGTPEGHKRNACGEEYLHGRGLGNGIPPHGAQEMSKMERTAGVGENLSS